MLSCKILQESCSKVKFLARYTPCRIELQQILHILQILAQLLQVLASQFYLGMQVQPQALARSGTQVKGVRVQITMVSMLGIMSQSDFKRLVAYSSIAHMGFILLGVYAFNEQGMQGAVMTMIAHGFSTAALFMMAGALQQRLHSREMSDMGGLWKHAPRMGAMTMCFVVASVGMPGLGNFVGEFLALLGAFESSVWLAVAATAGIVVAALYGLYLLQRSFQGEPNPNVRALRDFGAREMSVMILMLLGLVWLGVYPQPVLDLSATTIAGLGVLP